MMCSNAVMRDTYRSRVQGLARAREKRLSKAIRASARDNRYRDLRPRGNFIRTSIHDKFSGSIKITTHLDHISHCKTACGTNWLNRWTYRVFIQNTRRDEILDQIKLRVCRPGAAQCRGTWFGLSGSLHAFRFPSRDPQWNA